VESGKVRLTILSESAANTRGKLHLTAENTVIATGQQGPDYVCGRCGATLLAKTDRLLLMNAAGRCNKCGTYNNLSKPSPYPRIPVTAGHLNEGPPASDFFLTSPVWKNHPLANEFDATHTKFLQQWKATQGERPGTIYHYTNFEGLRGIVGSGKIRFSDAAFLNDASETQYALDLMQKHFEKTAQGLDIVQKELLCRASPSSSPF